MTKIFAITATVSTIALLAGAWYATTPKTGADQFAECRTSAIAGGAGAIGGPFELVREDGKTVTDKDVITEPSLLYFGYTFCPDVCPLDNARNVEAIEMLEAKGKPVLPVFISIDPERDTPEVMAEFTSYMHDRMVGLTGSPEQVKAASKAYRTYYKKQPAEDEYYLVDHSTFSYLVSPEHGFVEYFRRDVEPEQLASQLECFLDKM